MVRRLMLCVVAASACTNFPSELLFQCEADGGCPTGSTCVPLAGVRVCQRVDVDAGPSDAGASDAGTVDAGQDAGVDGGADAGACRCPTDGTCFESTPSCPGLVCGCPVGQTCGAGGQCRLPKVCQDDWCYEYPLPQGHHLFAAHAEPNYFVWGGERGVLFEWEGFETKFVPLPSARGDIIGIEGDRSRSLLLATSAGTVFQRGLADWTQVTQAPGVLNCEAFDFSESARQLDLGCARQGGGVAVATYTLGATSPSITTLPNTADGGVPARIAALVNFKQTDGGIATTAVVHRPGLTTDVLLRRPGSTTWAYVNAVTTDGGSLTQFIGPNRHATKGRRADVGLVLTGGSEVDAGSNGFVASTADGVVWQVSNTEPSLDGLDVTPSGFAFVGLDVAYESVSDGGLGTLLVTPSLHQRRWFASATTGPLTLTVGAFGATALFDRRQSQRSLLPDGGLVQLVPGTLMSSEVGLGATDLCGPEDGGVVYATFSAAAVPSTISNSPNIRQTLAPRTSDQVTLHSQNEFSGVMRRGPGGAWNVLSWGAAASWSPAVDQCHVDEQGGLHVVATPYLATSANGMWSSLLLPPSPTNTGTFVVQRYGQLWSSDTTSVISTEDAVTTVVRGTRAEPVMAAMAANVTSQPIETRNCAPFGFGGIFACLNNRPWTSDGGIWTSSNDLDSFGFASNAHGRRRPGGPELWTVRGTGELWQQNGCRTLLNCTNGFQRIDDLTQNGWRAARIWVDTDQLFFLSADVGGLNSATNPSTRYQVTRWQGAGRTATTPVPAWFTTGDLFTSPLTLWGDADELFLQWNRGVISRRKGF